MGFFSYSEALETSYEDLARGIEELLTDLCSHAGIFPRWSALAGRVMALVPCLRTEGHPGFKDLVAVHNELCVALDLLGSAGRLGLVRLDYEPASERTNKKLDFRLDRNDGMRNWVEVKTIAPEPKDDATKLKALKEAGRFPGNVDVRYDGPLAGELFHSDYTARGRMLEYTLETEERIAAQEIDTKKEECRLIFCGNGLDWDSDTLEDFVEFYQSGFHRDDDGYRCMEAFAVGRAGKLPRRLISHFAYLERSHTSLRPRSIWWSVRAPESPW